MPPSGCPLGFQVHRQIAQSQNERGLWPLSIQRASVSHQNIPCPPDPNIHGAVGSMLLDITVHGDVTLFSSSYPNLVD